ncbi:MAG TPA: LLM class flavin-dependent oxidoreductase [Stellaceae bacterium]|nr:LLM class flavin-dependent oxidoreductase [Stellaceae bacterium]
MALQFGIFDHLDEHGGPLPELFESRLKLIEQYDRAGFRSYHLAEHHSTTLGMAPSPSVFLAAVAQRTKRLRFGPLLYVTPLYHPLRLAEEIVMLDQMSNGRLELGLGRGASPIEIATYDIDPEEAPARNLEATEVILKALTSDVLNHEGKFYRYKNVRIAAHPLQKPYPPLWTAPLEPARAEHAARRGANIATLVPIPMAKPTFEAFRAEWKKLGKPDSTMPLIALTRHIVVAETDDKAREIARAAYRPWRKSMAFLWEWAGQAFPIPFAFPDEFDDLQKLGSGIAGSPATVRSWIEETQAESGISCLICDMVFGSMRYDDASRSIDLFAREVMPAFR